MGGAVVRGANRSRFQGVGGVYGQQWFAGVYGKQWSVVSG